MNNSEKSNNGIIEELHARIAELEAKIRTDQDWEFRAIIQSLPQAILFLDNNGKIILANAAVEKIFDTSFTDLMRVSLFDIRRAFKNEDGTAMEPDRNPLNVSLKRGKDVLGQVIGIVGSRTNKLRWFNVTAIPRFAPGFDSPVEAFVAFEEITWQKEATVSLLESEERYKRITETLTDYIYTVTFKNNRPFETMHGPGCFMVTGYTNEDFMKSNLLWIQMVHPDDRQKVRDFFNTILTRPLSIPIEHRIIRKDGVTRWVRNTPAFHFDPQGNMLSYDGLVQDITERKQSEEALHQSEERYRRLFNGIRDLVAVSEMLPDGSPGKFIEVNNVMCSSLGYSLTELQTMTALDIIAPVPAGELQKTAQSRLAGKNEIFRRELVAKNGMKIPVEISNQVVDIKGDSFVLAIARDITEKSKMDAELQKTQHLESLSMLAGGVAHDFNNLLGGIYGYIDIAREYSPSPQKSKVFLEKALASLERAKDLSQRLLTFSKGQTPSKKVADLASLIKEAAMLSLAGKNVKARISIDPDIYPCELDAAQISRVLSNIIVNAQQAMPDGGTVHIKAENMTFFAPPGGASASGPFVKISVRDTGVGIAGEDQGKIFDPFFTTKKSGTGLGLTICQSIVNKHGGVIDVTSETGGGAEFHIFLPASEKKAEAVLEKARHREPIKGKNFDRGRILVMDDEEFVLDIASRMLMKMGYTTRTSEHGEEACLLYKEALDQGNPFSCVILDLTIPAGMGGVKTMQRLLALDPKVKAIASSGYSDDPVFAAPRQYGFLGTLKKPYMANQLQDALHSILKESPGLNKVEGHKKESVAVNKNKKSKNSR